MATEIINSFPLQTLFAARARLGEGILWDDRSQRLIWVDIYNYQLHLSDPLSLTDQLYEVGDVVGTAVPFGSEHLLLAQRHHLTCLDLSSGQVRPLLSLETDRPENRFNDGKCDPRGGFWFGSMGGHPGQGQLYRYCDLEGTVEILETGITIANGLGWSPDQRTFYLTDSALGQIYAYDYDPPQGQIENRRVLIDLSQAPFVPDGLTIDQEGCLVYRQEDLGNQADLRE